MVNDYSFGIYKYTDKETGLIDYIHHFHLNHKPEIKFDEILQNNPDRWEYSVWYHVSTIEEANQLEYDLINLYRPRFNFKHGGNVKLNFYENFEYTVAKCGFTNSNKRNQQYCILGRYNEHIITSIDYEFLEDIAIKLNQKELTEDDLNTIDRFKYTVAKAGFQRGKQKYTIYSRNQKRMIQSIDYDFLESIVSKLNDKELTEEDIKKVGTVELKKQYLVGYR